MSTKATISHSDKYHLYKECFDEGLVYLQLDDPVCLQVDIWEASQGKVTVAVPIEVWQQIVEGWLNPHLENPDLEKCHQQKKEEGEENEA